MIDFVPPNSEILPLIHKMGGVLSNGNPCVITFIAAQSGEGTTSIAASFAQNLHTDTGKKILLITSDVTSLDNRATAGLVEHVISNGDISEIANQGIELLSIAWQTTTNGQLQSGRVLQDMAFWQKLRRMFDVVVIDAPALQKSSDGIAFARVADATIIIVEAESTRKEVIENLRDTLTAAGAKIAGAVLNKRNYHIPAHIYKRL